MSEHWTFLASILRLNFKILVVFELDLLWDGESRLVNGVCAMPVKPSHLDNDQKLSTIVLATMYLLLHCLCCPFFCSIMALPTWPWSSAFDTQKGRGNYSNRWLLTQPKQKLFLCVAPTVTKLPFPADCIKARPSLSIKEVSWGDSISDFLSPSWLFLSNFEPSEIKKTYFLSEK